MGRIMKARGRNVWKMDGVREECVEVSLSEKAHASVLPEALLHAQKPSFDFCFEY